MIQAQSSRGDFDVGIGVAPQERKSREPIFRFDRLADTSRFFSLQDASGGWKFRAGNFSSNGAGRDLDLRVVADALDLAQFAVRHEVKFVAVLGKPDGCVHRDAALAERREAEITVAVNIGGDARHTNIVIRPRKFLRGTAYPDPAELPIRLLFDC